ncbi:hypothetical protein CAPTEDRAFT_184860 [Capitella teleta]|uniref:Uncharacterized protein n=1 Tax=Capitella teleta TaxID=283909 RepID=X1ZH66_CAPTE|nr:hypothetical protein CAPTEDRAFT_184860 [Capitella teleta]|eukprot:ELT90074.1 hypothetical protein CAPTEDRAFT_184860 [Capitella teleta]
MAIERSTSLRLPNERPRFPVVKRDRNHNIPELDLKSIGEAPSASASAPTLNLAYFGPDMRRPPSLHHSKLDLAIENLSTTLERGTLRHRQTVELPARYRRNLLSSSLRSIFNTSGSDKSKRMPFNQPGLRMHLPPQIEEGVVFSDDDKDREDDANTAIKWLHQEILQIKKQDRALMRHLLGLRARILQISGGCQSSEYQLSASTTTLSKQTYHPLSADSWPLLGNSRAPCEPHQEEAKEMVQDFYHRVRAVSIVAVMPAGRAANELAERVKFQENHGRACRQVDQDSDQESERDRSTDHDEDSGRDSGVDS